MDIFNVKFENCKTIVISLDLVVVIVFVVLIVLIFFLIKKIRVKNIKVEEATIGIGNSSITVRYDNQIKEIAYKIWVELTTRKISIKFDEKYDVIGEVYDSWYEAFKSIRVLLEEIPGNRINDAEGLIRLTTKVLNSGLRPHLTAWQAKYKAWYKNYIEENSSIIYPQDIQKNFPEYQLLIEDLKKTNDIMINYTSELKRIIDDN